MSASHRVTPAAVLATILVASPARAADVITGLAADTQYVGPNNAYCQVDLYITFAAFANGYRLGAVFATDFDLTGFGFADCLHDDTSAIGTWAPQAVVNPLDSFVALGAEWGPGSDTSPDPLWGPQQFAQPTIPPGAGWFANNPPAMQGDVSFVALGDTTGAVTYQGLAALAARFILPADLAPGASISLSAGCRWQYALDLDGLDSVQGSFQIAPIPAPSATLLWLLAPAITRRRSRRA